MAVAQGNKPVKKTSDPRKSKTSSSHPPYIDMITDALVALKERTGSSHYAIAKHIEEQQKVRDLPPNFKKLLYVQLKRFVASGKLVKVKNSFKLPPAVGKKSPDPVTASAAESKPKSKAKLKEAAKKKEVTAKTKVSVPAKKEKNIKAKSAVKKVVAMKKVAPAKAKKPKSIKSPVKKAVAAKKSKK